MINIIGLGPGNTGYITKLGEKIIYSSDVVIGGRRNLESIEDFKGEKIVLSTNLKYSFCWRWSKSTNCSQW